MSESGEERRHISWDELVDIGRSLDEQERAEEERAEAEQPAVPGKSFLDFPDIEAPNARALSHTFKALGNELRMEIVLLLMVRPAYAGDIAYVLEEKPNHISRHLQILEQAGIVMVKKEGKNKLYELAQSAKKLLEAAGRN